MALTGRVTYPEVTESDARKHRRRSDVRAVHDSVDDVHAVRVVRSTEQSVEHVQLADDVGDVEQFDEQVQSDDVVPAMTAERREQQARQRVLQTERPLSTALRDDADWTLLGVLAERAFRRQISATDNISHLLCTSVCTSHSIVT